MTITEAKAQALIEAGVPGTGTASDAVVVCWPSAVGDDARAARHSDAARRSDAARHSGGDARGRAAPGGDSPRETDPGFAGEPEAFAGPRSLWGARLARATHAAVVAGLERH